MEFGEKLQELRKNEGLTQEELAEKLYVSRTAVSKWEIGKGYPNIESLKAISKLFNVSIDTLLSGDELLNLASGENSSIKKKRNYLIYGLLDFLNIIFIIFPLFGKKRIGTSYYNITIWEYLNQSYLAGIFLTLILVIILIGLSEIILQHFSLFKPAKTVLSISFIIEIATIFLFVLATEPYASAFMIILLLLKVVFLFAGLHKKG